MIAAVLLDMGGVLIGLENARGLPDSRFDWRGRQALLALIRARGGKVRAAQLDRLLFEPWQAEYERRYELGREANWKPHLTRLRRRAGVRLHDVTLLGAWFRPYGEALGALDGALETLSWLRRRGLALAVVSNVPMPGALYRKILDRHGLAASIDSFHFSYDEGSRKPSPVMVRHALAALGVDASQALMVGDRRDSDVAAARAAGVAAVWLRRPDGGGPAPDHTIDELAELPALVRRLGGGGRKRR
ncbi:MAG: HAD family hydrolase [Acidobacteriota bacterium]|nr:HAD family hydrolase [Acidobacteriota bacterium]MDH3522559.1 HAD family hydrolase [Acidobacteriota bacterium]